ncbi:MAG TPA: response regulator transcription factor [Chloroflexia bacterium]|jgi:DNA-binding NarL/FixJ family response regulator|nr:response regulator transcription factor [Chloroflexia bacterium]
MSPITVLLLSAHDLWVQVCTRTLESLPRPIQVVPAVLAENLDASLSGLEAIAPDAVLVSLDFPTWVSEMVPALRAIGVSAPVLFLCSYYAFYAFPELDDLVAGGVAGVVSSQSTLEELAGSLYALADDHPDPLSLQYLRAARSETHRSSRIILSDRERDILQLVAEDLTDREIGQRLDVSPHTVHNHLRHIYAKLGVQGRGGAVFAGIRQGILRVPR